eukprot:6491482-Amphidinium_carterae.2
MNQDNREACELRCSQHDTTGAEVTFILKGNIWTSHGKVFWNIGPVIEALLGSPKSFSLNKWLRRDAAELVETLGGLPGEHLHQSQRARQHHGTALSATDSQEYTISSFGLVRLMVWFVRSRRYERDRVRGVAALRASVAKLLQADQCAIMIPSDSTRIQCQQMTASGVCVHVHEVLSLECGESESPQERFASVLLQASRRQCTSVMSWLVELMHHCAALLDANACSRVYEHDISLAFESTHSSSKRRRMDEDVRHHLLMTAGRAKVSSQTCLQLTAPQTLLNKWLAESLVCYLGACHEVAASGPHTVSIAFDAARFGMPREETIAFFAWLPGACRSLWLPVQVPSALARHSNVALKQAVLRQRRCDLLVKAQCNPHPPTSWLRLLVTTCRDTSRHSTTRHDTSRHLATLCDKKRQFATFYDTGKHSILESVINRHKPSLFVIDCHDTPLVFFCTSAPGADLFRKSNVATLWWRVTSSCSRGFARTLTGVLVLYTCAAGAER